MSSFCSCFWYPYNTLITSFTLISMTYGNKDIGEKSWVSLNGKSHEICERQRGIPRHLEFQIVLSRDVCQPIIGSVSEDSG